MRFVSWLDIMIALLGLIPLTVTFVVQIIKHNVWGMVYVAIAASVYAAFMLVYAREIRNRSRRGGMPLPEPARPAVSDRPVGELQNVAALRRISLTQPLSELTRPRTFEEVIGQDEALKGLRAVLCGPNPQHVILYGPPGVGKTTAARIVLEEAKKTPGSPFRPDARFVEIDATTLRYDERGVADPLIGFVHDPIFQGASNLGTAGIPEPKPGAVTRAHGGVLFIDEIGELPPLQLNKLLKVLEDRKVLLESVYFNPNDDRIPDWIKDVFEHGLPADFRLVGATTRSPQDIPPALRSRCIEVFFRPLGEEDVATIARNAVRRIEFEIEEEAVAVVKQYAVNGRDAVNMIQIAAGVAQLEKRKRILATDVEWVVNTGQYTPRRDPKMPAQPAVGLAAGLTLTGPNLGTVVEVETEAIRVPHGRGRLVITGAIEAEEMGILGHVIHRKSTVQNAVQNVLTILQKHLDTDPEEYQIHVNFPGDFPAIDGLSLGMAIAVAIYSAITGVPVDNRVAMSGEVSIRGLVRPAGGAVPKIDAARRAGAQRVLIPKACWQATFRQYEDIAVVPVATLQEAIEHSLVKAGPPLASRDASA